MYEWTTDSTEYSSLFKNLLNKYEKEGWEIFSIFCDSNHFYLVARKKIKTSMILKEELPKLFNIDDFTSESQVDS